MSVQGNAAVTPMAKKTRPLLPFTPVTANRMIDDLMEERKDMVEFRTLDVPETSELEKTLSSTQTLLTDARRALTLCQQANEDLKTELQTTQEAAQAQERAHDLANFRLRKEMEKKDTEILCLRKDKDDFDYKLKMVESLKDRRIDELTAELSSSRPTTNKDVTPDLSDEFENLRELLSIETARGDALSLAYADVLSQLQETKEQLDEVLTDLQTWSPSLSLPDFPHIENSIDIMDLMASLPRMPACDWSNIFCDITSADSGDVIVSDTNTDESCVTSWNILKDLAEENNKAFLELDQQMNEAIQTAWSAYRSLTSHQSNTTPDIFSKETNTTVLDESSHHTNSTPAVFSQGTNTTLSAESVTPCEVFSRGTNTTLRDEFSHQTHSTPAVFSQVTNTTLSAESITRCEVFSQENTTLPTEPSEEKNPADIPSISQPSDTRVKLEISLCVNPQDIQMKSELECSGMTSYMSAHDGLSNDTSAYNGLSGDTTAQNGPSGATSDLGIMIDGVSSMPPLQTDPLGDFARDFYEYLMEYQVFHPEDVPPSDSSVFYFLLDRYLLLVETYHKARTDFEQHLKDLEEAEEKTKIKKDQLLMHLSQLDFDSSLELTDDVRSSTMMPENNTPIRDSTMNQTKSICQDNTMDTFSMSMLQDTTMTRDPLHITLMQTPTPCKKMPSTPATRGNKNSSRIAKLVTNTPRRVSANRSQLQSVMTPVSRVLSRDVGSTAKKSVTFRSPLLAKAAKNIDEVDALMESLEEKKSALAQMEQNLETRLLKIRELEARILELETALSDQQAQDTEGETASLNQQLHAVNNKLIVEVLNLDGSLEGKVQGMPSVQILSTLLDTMKTRFEKKQLADQLKFEKEREEWSTEMLKVASGAGNEVAEMADKVRTLELTIRDLESQRETLRSKLDQVEKVVLSLGDELGQSRRDCQEAVKTWELKMADKEAQLSVLENQVQLLEGTVSELEKKLNLLTDENIRLEQCVSDVSSTAQDMESMKLALDMSQHEKHELSAKLTQMSTVNDNLTEIMAQKEIETKDLEEEKNKLEFRLAETLENLKIVEDLKSKIEVELAVQTEQVNLTKAQNNELQVQILDTMEKLKLLEEIKLCLEGDIEKISKIVDDLVMKYLSGETLEGNICDKLARVNNQVQLSFEKAQVQNLAESLVDEKIIEMQEKVTTLSSENLTLSSSLKSKGETLSEVSKELEMSQKSLELLQLEVNHLLEEKKTLEESLELLEAQKRTCSEEWESKISKFNEEKNELRKQETELLNMKEIQEVEVLKLLSKKTDLDDAIKKLSAAAEEKENLLSGLKSELESRETVMAEEKELHKVEVLKLLSEKTDLDDVIKRLSAEAEVKENLLSGLKSELESRETVMAEEKELHKAEVLKLLSEKTDLDDVIKRLSAEAEVKENLLSGLKSELESRETVMAEEEELHKAEVLKILSEKTDLDDVIKRLSAEAEEKENLFSGLKSELESCKSVIKDLRAKIQEQEELKSQTKLQESEDSPLTKLQSQMQAKETIIMRLKAEVVSHETTITKLNAEMKNYETLSAKLAEKETLVSKLQGELLERETSLEKLDGELRNATENLSSKEDELKAYQDEKISLQECLSQKVSDLKELQTKVNELETEKSLVQDKLKLVEEAVEKLNLEAAALIKEKGALVASVGSNEVHLQELRNQVEQLEGEKVKLLHESNEKVEKLGLEVTGLISEKTTLEECVKNKEMMLEELKKQLDGVSEGKSTFNNEMTGLLAEKSELQKLVEENEQKVSDLTSEKMSLEKRVEHSEHEVADLKVAVISLEKLTEEKEQKVSDLTSEKISLEKRAEQAEQEIADLKLEQISLEKSSGEKDQKISDLTSKKISLEKRVEEAEQEVSDLKVKKISLEKRVEDAEQDVADLKLKTISLEECVKELEQEVAYLKIKKISLEELVEQTEQEVTLLKNEKKHAEAREQEVAKLMHEKISLEKCVSDKEVIVADLRTKLSELEIVHATVVHNVDCLSVCINNLEATVAQYLEDKQHIERMLDQSEKRVEELESELEEKQRARDALELVSKDQKNQISKLTAEHDIQVQTLNDANQQLKALLSEVHQTLELPESAVTNLSNKTDCRAYLRLVHDKHQQLTNQTTAQENMTVQLEKLTTEKLQFEIRTAELRALGESQKEQIEALTERLGKMEDRHVRKSIKNESIGSRRLEKLEEMNGTLQDLLTRLLTTLEMSNISKLRLISLREVEHATPHILQHAAKCAIALKSTQSLHDQISELDRENQELSDNVECLLKDNAKLETRILELEGGGACGDPCKQCQKHETVIKKSHEQITQLTDKMKGLDDENDELSKTIEELLGNNRKLEMQILEMQNTAGQNKECNACGKLQRSLSAEHDRVSQLNQQLMKHEDNVNSLNNKCRELEKQLQTKEEQLLRSLSNVTAPVSKEPEHGEKIRTLTKEKGMLKELLRQRAITIKGLEARIQELRQTTHNSNSMDSPIRDSLYNLRTRSRQVQKCSRNKVAPSAMQGQENIPN